MTLAFTVLSGWPPPPQMRSIMRLSLSFVGRAHPELLPPIYRWTAAILPSLAAMLRHKEHYYEDHLEGLLLPEELSWLRRRPMPPIAALQVRRWRGGVGAGLG